MIEVRNVTLDIETTRILTDVSLKVEMRSVTALVGPNAAGKTSLMRVMSGLLRPSVGQVVVSGHVVPSRMGAEYYRDQGIAFLPQGKPLPQRVRVGDLARAFPVIAPAPLLHATEDILQARSRRRQPVSSLSGGEQRVVAIELLIRSGAGVLLIDEPFAGLGPQWRRKVVLALHEIHADYGACLVLSGHSEVEFAPLSAMVCNLEGGRLLNAESPR